MRAMAAIAVPSVFVAVHVGVLKIYGAAGFYEDGHFIFSKQSGQKITQPIRSHSGFSGWRLNSSSSGIVTESGFWHRWQWPRKGMIRSRRCRARKRIASFLRQESECLPCRLYQALIRSSKEIAHQQTCRFPAEAFGIGPLCSSQILVFLSFATPREMTPGSAPIQFVLGWCAAHPDYLDLVIHALDTAIAQNFR